MGWGGGGGGGEKKGNGRYITTKVLARKKSHSTRMASVQEKGHGVEWGNPHVGFISFWGAKQDELR